MRLSLRNKLIAVCFSTTVFTGLMIIFVIIVGGALGRATIIVLSIGFVISLLKSFTSRVAPAVGFGPCTQPSPSSSTVC